MPDEPRILKVEIKGDVGGDVTIAGRDVTSVWEAAHEQKRDQTRVKPPIFVSYASDDREKLVLPLVERLQEKYTLWFDRHDIEGGDEWKREIDAGIRKCSVFLATLTPRSADPDREWVMYEQREALRLFAPILPVLLEACALPEHLKHLQAIDLTKRTDAAFDELCRAIDRLIHRRGTQWLTDQSPGAQSRTFVGRERELREVYAMLHEGQTLAVAAVQGMGGIGKTMLAGELARRLGPRYPGGVIWEELGESPPPLDDVLRRWLEYAGEAAPPEVRPADVSAVLKPAGEVLVVMDDVWPDDFAAVKTLLEVLPEDAERMLTTRFEDGARAIGAGLYRLERLDEADGLALLRDRLKNANGPLPGDDLLKRLYTAVDGHALALELAAGRVKDNARFEGSVQKLEAHIASGDVSDIALNVKGLGKDVSLAASLDISMDALREDRPQLADRFPMLGVFAEGAPFDADAAAAVWDMAVDDEGEAEEALDALVGYGLLRAEEGRYSQHMLLRAYALGLLNEDSEAARAAHERHLVHFGTIASTYSDETWREVEREAANIAQAAEWACDLLGDEVIGALAEPEPPDDLPEHDEDAAQVALAIASTTRDYVDRRRVHAGLRWLRAGLAAARLTGERKGESLLLNELGLWYHQRGQLERALDYYKQSAAHDEQLGDEARMATSLTNIGEVYRATGSPGKALECFQRALPIHREVGNRTMEATTLSNMGSVYYMRERYEQALTAFLHAQSIFEDPEARDDARLAVILNNIGGVHLATDQPQEALEAFQRALSMHRAMGNRAMEAITLNNLGTLYHATHRNKEALEALQRALPISRQVDEPRSVAALLANIAMLLREMGRRAEAISRLEEAIATMQAAGLQFSGGGTSLDEYQSRLAQWRAEDAAGGGGRQGA